MKNKALTILIFLLISILPGCISQSGTSAYYLIYITPNEDSETTLIIPLILDKNSGNIDSLMYVDPRFGKGNASLKIIETEKGPALKITTKEEIQIDISIKYDENMDKLIYNKTLSMTNISSDEIGRPLLKSWVYTNSTTNQVNRFRFIFSIGDEETQILEIRGTNASNGWHQFTVKEGYGIT